MKITPIETEYRGYLFRSRQEARWAVLFDALYIPWRYEFEGFKLNGNGYLPDFFLPDMKTWVEVKGLRPMEMEFEKATFLALANPEHTVVLTWENFDQDTSRFNFCFWHDENSVFHSQEGCHWLGYPEEEWASARRARFDVYEPEEVYRVPF